jgi:intraflagellar transport protein 122
MTQGAIFNDAIFNASRFLINSLGKLSPAGISKVNIYYALSYLGTKFETFKTARFGYERLQTLKIPSEWQDEIDSATLKVRSKPFSDKEGFQPICNRCMNANSLINANGDFCGACGHPFIRNFIGFDTLPLVEFKPAENIPLNKVLDLLKLDPPHEAPSSKAAVKKPKPPTEDGWKESIYGDQQALTFQQEYGEDSKLIMLMTSG